MVLLMIIHQNEAEACEKIQDFFYMQTLDKFKENKKNKTI